jgi:FlaA1/EpsC-like NDP-sugar epimerase
MVLIGASHTAQALIKDYSKKYDIQAIIDDDISLKNTYISNIKVHSLDDFDNLVANDCKIIITKELESSIVNTIFTLVHTKKISDINIVKELKNNSYNIQDISIEDLLPRSPKDFDKKATLKFIKNKTILITGAGGSIGSEIVKQCVSFGAKEILLLDHSEFNLYTIGQSIDDMGFVDYKLLLKSVVNKDSLEKVFKENKIQILIHAAAYKHVSLVQLNIKDAITNNIIGTKNAIDLAIKYNLESFVLISTDKAIRPTSIMGATKRICELYAHAVPSKNTEIVAVRFGNVLGSSGSVIPKFKAQIEQGQNITVTHPDITRYFMLIPEACQLVLQAASIARGGELFILDMGEPIKIVDLAKKMIALSGRDDIEIEFIGLRQGEKLYEELLIDSADLKTEYNSIMVSKNPPVDYDILLEQLERLVCENSLVMLKEMVPEFEHKADNE